MAIQPQNNNFLIGPTFTNVNRLFCLFHEIITLTVDTPIQIIICQSLK